MRIKNEGVKDFLQIAAFAVVLVLIVALFAVLSPKEKTDRELLYQVQENIGITGILDFVNDYWTDDEIIEYLSH